MLNVICIIVVVIGAVFFHEVGHLVAFRRYGVAVKTICVGLGPPITVYRDRHGTRWGFTPFLLGGYVSTEDEDAIENVTPAQAAIIAFAGPLANIIMAFAIALITYDTWPAGSALAHLNFLLAVLNLIPVPPLDGGRILFAGLRAAIGDAVTAKIRSVTYPLGFIFVICWQLYACFAP